jgi:DeoR family transcriptional regulator, glycerol-3-phosphate regulon repressor
MCRVMVERAERVIVAADASKFTAKGLTSACPLAEIDLLVTDATPPAELVEALEAADVEVMVA